MNLSNALAVIGLLTSIIGIPITFILARRARQRPELRYSTEFNIVLNPSDNLFDEGLKMTLGDQAINRISRTRIAIWNNRGDTIRESDILRTDPLRIVFEMDDHPLQARIIGASRRQIALMSRVDGADPSVLISFDFLDAGDGGIVEVIHRGLVSPEIQGTVRGAKIVSNGDTDLDLSEIVSMAGRSRSFRMLITAGRYGTAVGLGCIVLFAMTLFWRKEIVPAFSYKSGRLIDSQRYHLNTASGQIKFAKAVTGTKYYQHAGSLTAFIQSNKTLSIVAVTCLVIIIIAFIAGSIYRTAVSRIPVSIALHQEAAAPLM